MIGFVGLSHLGIVSSVATASKGHQVIAYDPDSQLCSQLSNGVIPIFEPGLQELFDACRSHIQFADRTTALEQCELIYFSADTPTDKDNRASLSSIRELLDQAVAHVSPGATLVVLSQVPPGFTRALRNDLRSEMFVCYQVETLIIGRAVERALHPERIIIGCERPSQGLPRVLSSFLETFTCPVFAVLYESAELAKVAVNVYLAASIGVTNTLSELCESIGADWAEIAPVLKLDKRIGPHAYLTPGLGVGGGNIERDLMTASSLASDYGVNYAILSALAMHSSHRRNWLRKTLEARVLPRYKAPTLAIWGLSYKPGTQSTRNSPSLDLIDALNNSLPVRVYDPEASLSGRCLSNVVQVSSALAACEGADALIIMTGWDEFAGISPFTIRKIMSGTVVVDVAAVWDRQAAVKAGFEYYSLGARPSLPEGA